LHNHHGTQMNAVAQKVFQLRNLDSPRVIF